MSMCRFFWQWIALECCIQYGSSSMVTESLFFLLSWAYYSSKMGTLYCFYYWCCRKKLVSFWPYSQQEKKLIVEWMSQQACIYILESSDQRADWRSKKLLVWWEWGWEWGWSSWICLWYIDILYSHLGLLGAGCWALAVAESPDSLSHRLYSHVIIYSTWLHKHVTPPCNPPCTPWIRSPSTVD